MANIILIVGGSRSGKSEYARKRAESLPGPRLFLATCPPIDEEMKARIQSHQLMRSKSDWDTVEEYTDLVSAIRNIQGRYHVILVDCLTLWVNNLMQKAAVAGKEITELEMVKFSEDIVRACAEFDEHIFFVSNEVGMGIVPDNSAARRFRDLAGRCNQSIAAAADEVVFVSCGLPVYLKGKASGPS